MPLFRELIANSTDGDNLQSFVISNINHFHNLNNGHYDEILAEKNDIRDFIELKGGLLENINYEYSQCKAFISILFDFCERFGFLCTARIENTLSKKDLHLGRRREAAKLYLLQVRNNDDYINRFEQICTLIQCSIETEEDSDVKPVVTFLNFFAKIVRDTSDIFISEVKSKIRNYSDSSTYPFLLNQVIQDAWSIPTDDIENAYLLIQSKIETYLGHFPNIECDIEEIAKEIIIEKDSEYSHLLAKSTVTFELVRNIALENTENISQNLHGRGVNPLRNEEEMFIYLKRYGNMHKSKLLSAFEFFPFQNINTNIEIIDWGCGQGLASLVFLDYLKENNINIDIRRITLIEPSQFSIRRAALHISLANKNISLKTICNVFNCLENEDIKTKDENIKIHFFSNILDIDEALFSQDNLIRLIEETQKGINYFICISPYINDEKTDRVDSFKRFFITHYQTYTPIYEISNSGRLDDEYWNCNNFYNGNMGIFCRHPECGCSKKWTRVIRVFKVEL